MHSTPTRLARYTYWLPIKFEALQKELLDAETDYHLWKQKLDELVPVGVCDMVSILDRPDKAIQKNKPFLRNLSITAILGFITGLLIHLPFRRPEQKRHRQLTH